MAAANERFPVKLYPSAVESDVLFYCVVDEVLSKNKGVEYGALYHDILPNAPAGFEQHRLVYIEPARADGKQHWYFAADRTSQDDYNWSLNQGGELIRDYLVERNLYYERTEDEAGSDGVAGEFYCPEVPTLDARFPSYGFADDTVMEAPKELRSRYIVVRRRYIEPVTTDFPYDETFQRHIVVTRELIPAGSFAPTNSPPGMSVEVQHGNRFHDVVITKELLTSLGSESDGIGYELPSYPSSYDRQFPGKLESVDLIWVWAWADSTGFAESYSEDYFFKFKITEARPGPYAARVRRFITDNPDGIKAGHPIFIVPQPVTESIAVVSAWYFASSETGNATSAAAKEWSVPSTIHNLVPVNLNGLQEQPATHTRSFTESLAATPGAAAFFSASSGVMDYDVIPRALGLYEVRVVEVDFSNLYT